MRLELRGLLFYFVSYLTIEEHEGREALFRHGCVTSTERRGNVLIRSLASLMTSRRGALVARRAARAFERLFRRQLAGWFLAPGVAFAACSRSLPLDVRLMRQRTQSGVQRGAVRGSAGRESKRSSRTRERPIGFVTS